MACDVKVKNSDLYADLLNKTGNASESLQLYIKSKSSDFISSLPVDYMQYNDGEADISYLTNKSRYNIAEEYDTILPSHRYKGKNEYLTKHKIQINDNKSFYYVLSDKQQIAINNYRKHKTIIIGNTNNGFELVNNNNSRIVYKIYRNKGWLLVEDKEYRDVDGVKLPTVVSKAKLKADLVYNKEEEIYNQSIKLNKLYIPGEQREINKYLFKIKGISAAKSANYYLLMFKNAILNYINNYTDNTITYEDLKQMTEDDVKNVTGLLNLSGITKKIEQQFINEVNSINIDEKKAIIHDRFLLQFGESVANDVAAILNVLPDELIRLLSISVITDDSAYLAASPEYIAINLNIDFAFSTRKALALNVALRKVYDYGLITNHQIEQANSILTEELRNAMVEGKINNSTINKTTILDSVIPNARNMLARFWEEAERDMIEASMAQNSGLVSIMNKLSTSIKKYNTVFSSIAVGQVTSNYLFNADTITILLHELGHAIDLYLATNNKNNRDKLINFIEDISDSSEFISYLKYGLASRGYDVSNKKEIAADIYAYIIGRSIGYDFSTGHLQVLDDFFTKDSNMELVNKIYNRYFNTRVTSISGFSSKSIINQNNLITGATSYTADTVVNIDEHPILKFFRELLNDIIKEINNILGTDIFKTIDSPTDLIVTTIPGTFESFVLNGYTYKIESYNESDKYGKTDEYNKTDNEGNVVIITEDEYYKARRDSITTVIKTANIDSRFVDMMAHMNKLLLNSANFDVNSILKSTSQSDFKNQSISKSYTSTDVIKYLQNDNIVSKRVFNNKYWVKKGQTIDGKNLLEQNKQRIRTFNRYYEEKYNQSLVFVHNEGTSAVVEVNELFLQQLNDRNKEDIHYASVSDPIGDIEASVINTGFSKVQGISVKQEAYVINIASNVLLKAADAMSALTIEDAIKGNTVRGLLTKLIKHNSFARHTDSTRFKKLIDVDKHNLNVRLADKISTDDLLWNKIKIHAKLNSGINITEIEDLNIDPNEVSNTFNENQQFLIPPDSRISSKVKNLINNTVDSEQRTESIGGIPTVLNASDIIPHFIQNISSATNKKEMLDMLLELSNANKAYKDIHSVLLQDTDMANAFFSNFRMESLIRITNVLNKESKDKLLELNVSNKESYIQYSLSNSWINTLRSRVNSEFYINANLFDSIVDNYNDYLSAKADDRQETYEIKIDKAVAFFSAVGIDITNTMLHNLVNDNKRRATVKAVDSASGAYGKSGDYVNDSISSAILDTVLLNTMESIESYINKIEDNPEFNGYGYILSLAENLSKYFIPETTAYINNVGNQEQTFNKPTFIGDWFNLMNDDEMFKARLVNMVKDPMLRNSMWLLNTSTSTEPNVLKHNGFLNIPEDVPIKDVLNNLDKLELNKEFYHDKKTRDFNLYHYDGFSEISNNQNLRYTDILDGDWAFVNFAKYINGNKFTEESFKNTTTAGNGLYPLINPGDRGNFRDISAPIFELEAKHLKGTVDVSMDSVLFKAVRNHFRSQVLRMESARNELYTIDDKGNRKYTSIDKLRAGYHFKRTHNPKTDKVNISKIKNGKLVGDAFKFYNFSFTDSRGDTQDINSLFTDTPGIEVLKDNELMPKVDNFIDRMISKIINEQRSKIVPILNDNRNIRDLAKRIKPIDTLIAEYAINRYIANTEMLNFFVGDVAFYGSSDAANKRASILLSSGMVNSHSGTNTTFNGATVDDRVISADIISNIESILRKQNISEPMIISIIRPYKTIESTDGISYITLDEFNRRTILYGVNDKYKDLIDKLNDPNSTIDINDLDAFIQLQKNIYHSYEFDGTRYAPTQVKNSEFVLIPRLIQGTELGVIHEAMVRNNIAQLNFATAEKVGSTYIGNITKGGKLNAEVLDAELTKASKQYFYKDLRKQQDIVNHIIDTVNRYGTQLAKKILDNIKDETIIDEVFQLTVANIVESADKLKDELGVKQTEDGYTVDIEKLSDIMTEQYIAQSKNNNYLFGAEVDKVTNTFKLPLDMSVTRVKNESLFNSLFTNNIINQKHPGIHGPQASNAFMNAVKYETTKEGAKPFRKEDTTIRPLHYSSYTTEDGRTVFNWAEVLLPAWSRKFFGDGVDITIEDLKAAGLDKMLGYRIPTEGKQSIFIFKVVGFLDSTQGSSIVVPDAFVAQTGADFDIDSVYTMSYNFYINRKSSINKINYETEVTRNWYNKWVRSKLESDNKFIYDTFREDMFNISISEANKLYKDFVSSFDFKGDLKTFISTLKSNEIKPVISTLNDKRRTLLDKLIPEYRSMFDSDKKLLDEKDIRGIERIEYYLGTIDAVEEAVENDTSSNPLKIEANKNTLNVVKELEWIHETELRLYGISQDRVKEYIAGYSSRQKVALGDTKTKQQELFNTIENDVIDMIVSDNNLTTYDEFNTLATDNPVKYNTKKARQNRILDRYIEILSNPAYYLENVTPNMFDDIAESKSVSDTYYNPASNLTNYASPTTQDLFRRISLASRDLKGISVNGDSFVSNAQRIGLMLAEGSGVEIQYNIGKPIKVKSKDGTITIPSYTIEELQNHFGKDNVTEDGIVTLNIFGNNNAGTFKNIDGKLITTYVAQATANILDSVKFPLPYNVSKETVNIWRLIPTLGGSWTTATLLINQNVVNRINNHANSKNSISLKYKGYPINGAKFEIAKEIYHYYAKTNDPILNKLDGNKIVINRYTKAIRSNKRADVGYGILNQIIDLSDNNIAISDKFLIDQLDIGNNFSKIEDKDRISYLRNQLGILNYYNELSLIQTKISDFQELTAYDKSKVGPEFIDIAHNKDLYNKVTSNDYNNILITKDGKHYIDAIYGEGSNTILKAFKENGSDMAYNIFNKYFITQSAPIKYLLRQYPKEQHKAVIDYVLAYNTGRNKFFDISDRARVTGMTKQSFEGVDVNTVTKESIEAFKKLSAVNKLMIIKNAYKEYIDDTNLLYYLTPIYTTEFVNKYNYTDIGFKSDKNDNIFIDSFTKLWYNNNIYVHLLAQDLVKLSFFLKGLTFGRNISKVVPASVLYNPNMPFVDAMGEVLGVEGEPILHGVGYTTTLDKQRALHFEPDFNNVYDEKFRVNFARSSWRNSTIVPKIIIDDIPSPDGKGRVLKPGSINWRSRANDGVITVTRNQFSKMPYYLRNADVVKDYNSKGIASLLAKVETTNAKGDLVYKYIPVTKLDAYEFDDKSINPINQEDRVLYSYDEYVSNIQIKGDVKSTEYAERTVEDESKRQYTVLTTFEADKSSGYRNRTRLNATADATIAIAINFDSAGEKLTKKMVDLNNKLYIPIDFEGDISAETLINIVDKLNKQQVRILNIAGNGIATFSGSNITQKQIDNKVYDILHKIYYHPKLKYGIEKIRSGGQTGVDEAGIKAARQLAIPNYVLAPGGFKFRNAKGIDISNKEQFIKRFDFISNKKPESHPMSYQMPTSNNIFGRNTTTLREVEFGNRIATTRSNPLGKIGDVVTFNGSKTQYVIVNVEKLTDKLVTNPRWIEEWSRKEGWTVDYFKSILGKKRTVRIGSHQTTFTKVEFTDTPVYEDSYTWFDNFNKYVSKGTYQKFIRDLTKSKSIDEINDINRAIREVYVNKLNNATELGEVSLNDDNSTVTVENWDIITTDFPTATRLMVGNHGLYVEFNTPDDKGTFVKKRLQYNEYNYNGIKLYDQFKTVNYADYKIGKWYVDLYDVIKAPRPNYKSGRITKYKDNSQDIELDFKAEVSEPVSDYIDYNKSRMKYVKDIITDYNTRLKQFPTLRVLRTTVKRLNKITWGENQISGQLAALRANIHYVDSVIEDLESKFFGDEGYSKPEVLKAIINSEDRLSFTRAMNYANTFLKGFDNIKNIQPVRSENLTKDERSLNSVINKLTSYSQRVNTLRSTHRTISNTYFEQVLTPLSTNPAIKLGMRQLFDVQDDESRLQLMLDSLGDTNHSFVANFIKKFIVDRGLIRKQIRDKEIEYDDKIKGLLKDTSFDDIIEQDNKLIQEFDDSYKEEWQNYKDKIIAVKAEFTKYSRQYYNLEKEYIKWRQDNILSEEFKEVEQAKIDANDILFKNFTARKLMDEIKEAKNRILSNNDGLADMSEMSTTDRIELAKLDRKIELLQNPYTLNGIKKTSIALDVAETISSYMQAHGELIAKYYTPVIENAVYKKLYDKHTKSRSKVSKEWVAENTYIKIDAKFWDDFSYHSVILGRDNIETAVKALKPFRDKDGVVNGNLVNDKLREVIKEANESRHKDVDGKPIKAVAKPDSNEAYSDDYYKEYENRGEDGRESDETILQLIDDIEDILKNYLNSDGLLDTTAISIEDLDKLIELQYTLELQRSYSYEINIDRDLFNTWYRQTHDRVTNTNSFNKAKNKASTNGRAYSNRWNKLNTALRLEDTYYKMLDKLRSKFNLGGRAAEPIQKRGGINIEFVQKLYNVDSFDKLPANIIKLISNSKQDSYSGVIGDNVVYTLKNYINYHAYKGKSTRFNSVSDAQNHIKLLYNKRINKEVGSKSKYFKYLNAYEKEHTIITTKKYNRLLAKHGTKSAWYTNNHTINHRGEIIPVPYWTITRPKDKSMFTENAPNPKYWSYSIVKDKKYVDKAKSKSKKWMNDNVEYVETPYYKEKHAEMKSKSKDEYDKWFEDNHYYNAYTHKYQPISIWTTMITSDKYTNKHVPLKMMTSNKIKPKFDNNQETRDSAYDAHNAKPENKDDQLEKIKLHDPYRSMHNKPLPRKTSKYYYDNRTDKNPKYNTYDAVKKNPLYAYVTELLQDLTSHYDKDTILDEQQLPIFYKIGDEQANSTAKRLLKKAGWYNYGSKAVVGENNESVHMLNLPNVSPINKEKELDIPKEAEFPTRQEYLDRYAEVAEHNREIRKINKEYNSLHMDKNYEDVLRSFINTAYSHKFMYNNEHEMRMALEEIRNLDLAKRRNLLERLRNITRENLSKEKPELFEDDPAIATSKGVGSNLERHFRSFMEMIFYGEFELDEGNWTKISRVMQNFTSAKGMWFNVPGAFNNVAYGLTQMALEQHAGYYFSTADLAKAQKMYYSGIFSMMSELGQDKSNNYANAIIKDFDVVELQDELAITNNIQLDKSIQHHLLSTNTLYILHHIGEHYMQNSGLIAMMYSHRLINGEIKSFADFTYDKQYNALMDVLNSEGKHSFDKFIEDNKYKDLYLDGKSDLIRDFILQSDYVNKKEFLTKNKELYKEAKAEFEGTTTIQGKEYASHPRLIDVYKLDEKTKRLTTNINPLTNDKYDISHKEYELFRRKVVSVNQKIHGIYNKLDAGTVQKYGLGRLVVQFKKWMRPGWIKRFGSRVGKTHWNESRGEYDTGMYVSSYRFLTKPIGDNVKGIFAKELSVAEGISKIFSDYRNYISNVGLYWNTLNDTDKANIKRTMTEMVYFAAVGVIMWMLQGLADGDEDDKKWAYALYATDRLMTEILAYNPFYGFTNETRKLLRDPFAAMAMLDDVGKLVYTSMFERDQYYKGGIYHGESKLAVQWKKNIPLFNRYLRYENIEDYAGYYKLY